MPPLSRQPISIQQVETLLMEKGLLLSPPTLSQVAFSTLTTHSKRLQPGQGFLAYSGVSSDGNAFLQEASTKGAACLIGEIPWTSDGTATPYLRVRNARAAWAWIESALAGHPQTQLTCFGVTGTNGKTSTVWMTRALLEKAGIPCLSIGSLGAFFPHDYVELAHTTPDPDVLFPLLAQAVAQGIRYVVMEVASHSLEQEKVTPLQFAAAVLTNFSRDHLDFHPSMEAYWQAKIRLFSERLLPEGRAIVECDWAARLFSQWAPISDTWTYGPMAPLPHIKSISLQPSQTPGHLAFSWKGKTLEGPFPFLGVHNQENFLAALLLAEKALAHLPPISQWQEIPQIPGRLEKVAYTPLILVDHSHKPAALQAVLQVVRTLTTGKVWVVMGCGGDRDRGKRPQMGAVAAQHADVVCLTSDNPRSEDPFQILAEIQAGIPPQTQTPVHVIENRRTAIAFAISHAAPQDAILLAGKGNENVQLYGKEKRPFCDKQVALSLLQERQEKK